MHRVFALAPGDGVLPAGRRASYVSLRTGVGMQGVREDEAGEGPAAGGNGGARRLLVPLIRWVSRQF